MSAKIVVALSVLLVAAQAATPRIGLNLPGFGSNRVRVSGGTEAGKFEFRHQVSLQWAPSSTLDYQHFCGGSLIDEQWVLTSAQCVIAIPSDGKFVVRGGKHNLAISENDEQVVWVEDRIIHEKYKVYGGPYDIALLYIPMYLVSSKAIEPIQLPKNVTKRTGTGIFSGWGFPLPDSPEKDFKLQKVVLPIIDYDTCKLAIEDAVGPNKLHPTNICTKSLTGKVCAGDFGGPLIQENDSEVNELIGVASWTAGACDDSPGAPSVYVDVAQFGDWIETNMKKYPKN